MEPSKSATLAAEKIVECYWSSLSSVEKIEWDTKHIIECIDSAMLPERERAKKEIDDLKKQLTNAKCPQLTATEVTTNERIIEEIKAARERSRRVEDAASKIELMLDALIDYMERERAGFPQPIEQYYAIRDNGKSALAAYRGAGKENK